MNNDIPKDFANQRPRYMARKRPTAQDAPLPLIVIGFVAALCGVLALGALLGTLYRYVNTADNPTLSAAYGQEAKKVSATQSIIYTSTPEPTVTPEPTRTPWPTFALETLHEVNKSVDIPQQIVTVEVTRLVSLTPEPTKRATQRPTITPNYQATQQVYVLAEFRRADRAKQWEQIKTVSGEVLIGLVMFGVVFAALFKVIAVTITDTLSALHDRWNQRRHRALNARVAERRQEKRDAEIVDRMRRLNVSGKDKLSKRDIEYVIKGYEGGAAHKYVKKIAPEKSI